MAWSSRRCVLRDLTRAQGGPAAGARPLPAAARPPPLRLREDTEEEYFQDCIGDEGVVDEPDLGLIQQMLDMVRDLNISEDEVSTDDVMMISKLNPTSSEFIPCNAITSSPMIPSTCLELDIPLLKNIPSTKRVPPVKKLKRIKQRNIALESIFQAMEREHSQEIDAEGCNGEPLKLLKPEDLVPSTLGKENFDKTSDEIENIECNKCDKHPEKYDLKAKSLSVEKVNDWMSQMMSPIRTKPVAVILDPTSMFKKKSKVKTESSNASANMDSSTMFKKKEASSSACNGPYVPSTQASHYYQKYLEKSQLMDSFTDDIWTKAEKKMKLIDETRRLAAVRRAAEAEAQGEAVAAADAEGGRLASSASEPSDHPGFVVPPAWSSCRLPSPRHAGAARASSCVVCAALCAPGPAGTEAPHATPCAPGPAGTEAPHATPCAPGPAGTEAPHATPCAPGPAGTEAPHATPCAPGPAGTEAPHATPCAPGPAGTEAPHATPCAPGPAGTEAPHATPCAPGPAGTEAPHATPCAPGPAGTEAPHATPCAPGPAGTEAPHATPCAPGPAGTEAPHATPCAPGPAGTEAPHATPCAPGPAGIELS